VFHVALYIFATVNVSVVFVYTPRTCGPELMPILVGKIKRSAHERTSKKNNFKTKSSHKQDLLPFTANDVSRTTPSLVQNFRTYCTDKHKLKF